MALFDWIYGEGLALAFIKKGIEEALPIESVLADLSKGGIFIRPELATNVYNYLQGAVKVGAAYVKSLQLNYQPNILRLPLSLTSQLRNFSYQVQVQGFSSATGVIELRQINISTNAILTKQQAIDMATNLAEGDTKSGGLESGAGTVTGITQNSAGLVLP